MWVFEKHTTWPKSIPHGQKACQMVIWFGLMYHMMYTKCYSMRYSTNQSITLIFLYNILQTFTILNLLKHNLSRIQHRNVYDIGLFYSLFIETVFSKMKYTSYAN